jgi:hypothetical protein
MTWNLEFTGKQAIFYLPLLSLLDTFLPSNITYTYTPIYFNITCIGR